jgi:undecaprenyl diphosphate synthase
LNSKASRLFAQRLDPTGIPVHVAIIMDGNGRWAQKRLLNRVVGHEKGVDTVRTVVRVSREVGISVLTLYAFSTENWGRPKTEVSALMKLLKRFVVAEEPEMQKNGIRLHVMGQLDRLPADVQQTLRATMARTGTNEGLKLNLALSYGGREEILRMVRHIADKVQAGRLASEAIDEALIARHLYTAGLPDPDLLIRTSGEMRISNFLLWQIAYSEIFVTSTLWPDFDEEEYLSILEAFQRRDRRFGKVKS